MSESPAPKPAAPTFESGARAMNEALQTKGVEAYFADASDPLHKAFIAKAAVHSGPGGRPLIGEEAEKAIDSHYDTPRSGRSLAYIHVPFARRGAFTACSIRIPGRKRQRQNMPSSS